MDPIDQQNGKNRTVAHVIRVFGVRRSALSTDGSYARLVSPQMILDVTAIGNYRQGVFPAPEDYQMYLNLLERYSRQFELSLSGAEPLLFLPG